ncbi:MAG: hypothetical protein J6J35_01680 [Alphaproteobacteria bacterium]|nr:hypothetical protein [Alphaproteobacteria bacterium]
MTKENKPQKKISGNLVKKAPEKIVVHALNTAISTVEKAAVTDVKRTAKRAKRTEMKLEKAKKAASAAKKDVKRATGFSATIEKMEVKETSTQKIKEKIKEIITPEKTETFYYDRRQLFVLAVVYALIAGFVFLIAQNAYNCCFCFGMLLKTFLLITEILIVAALSLTVFVLVFPQKLAVITKKDIKIDHNAPLKWEDVEEAEEKYTSYLTRRPLIALHLKENALKNYRLTFMQHLCKSNIFTPFSIPMYAMRPEDAAKIRTLIKKHTKYVDNRN